MTATAEEVAARLQSWDLRAQEQVADLVARARTQRWRPWWCGNYGCDGKPHGDWTWRHARGDQHPPRKAWDTWIELSGRGAGKTRSGSEWTHKMTKRTGFLALVAPTAFDARNTMVEGESGLLATADPKNPCTYEPSKARVTWANGARATLFSAEKANRLRGPQHGASWVDEACFMPNIVEVWDNLQFGLRLGSNPRVHVTTTPKPSKWLKALLAEPETIRSTASTYANLDNLAPKFKRAVLSKYEGTRTGRQEIHAEVLDDVVGALWNTSMILRVSERPTMDAIVVAVDPSGTATGDEAGIVVVGRAGDYGYVLEDLSGQMSPEEWARVAIEAHKRWNANAVVIERFGGDLATLALKTIPGSSSVPIIGVNARQGKALRAESVVSLYEQGRILHVGTAEERDRLSTLEEQMTEWVPSESPESPDRVDALVHGLTHLLVKAPPASVSNPAAGAATLPGSYRQGGAIRRLYPGSF